MREYATGDGCDNHTHYTLDKQSIVYYNSYNYSYVLPHVLYYYYYDTRIVHSSKNCKKIGNILNDTRKAAKTACQQVVTIAVAQSNAKMRKHRQRAVQLHSKSYASVTIALSDHQPLELVQCIEKKKLIFTMRCLIV